MGNCFKMGTFFRFCVLFVIFVQIANSKNSKSVFCYYGTWATYRAGNGKFDVDNIDTRLCTHAVYTFVGLAEDGSIRFLDPYLDLPDNWGRDNFGKFNALKKINPELKTILAVGGWNEGSAKYSIMANNPALRKVFVQSATETLIKYGFDGLDMDWEYPNRRDTVRGQADIDNFTQLLKDLRESFDEHGFLLSAAVASVEAMSSLSYDIPAISKTLDFVNLMTYDMYGAWDAVTGHNAPLHRGIGDEEVPAKEVYSVDVALQYWLDQGCLPEKILLGLPLYGRTFTLIDAANSGVRALSSGPGIAGPYTAQNGVIGYNEFCGTIQTETWDLRYDNLAKVPYAVRGRDWVSFDDADSLTIKAKYALDHGLGGIMVWSIETDDFHGLCHQDPFPLLRSVNAALGRNISHIPSTTSSPSTSSSSTTSTVSPGSSSTSTSSSWSSTTVDSSGSSSIPPLIPEPGDICQEEGYAKDLENCSVFYICTRADNGGLIPHKFTCPGTLLWDHRERICNYQDLVDCGA